MFLFYRDNSIIYFYLLFIYLLFLLKTACRYYGIIFSELLWIKERTTTPDFLFVFKIYFYLGYSRSINSKIQLSRSLVHACSVRRNRSGRLKLTKNISFPEIRKKVVCESPFLRAWPYQGRWGTPEKKNIFVFLLGMIKKLIFSEKLSKKNFFGLF